MGTSGKLVKEGRVHPQVLTSPLSQGLRPCHCPNLCIVALRRYSLVSLCAKLRLRFAVSATGGAHLRRSVGGAFIVRTDSSFLTAILRRVTLLWMTDQCEPQAFVSSLRHAFGVPLSVAGALVREYS